MSVIFVLKNSAKKTNKISIKNENQLKKTDEEKESNNVKNPEIKRLNKEKNYKK